MLDTTVGKGQELCDRMRLRDLKKDQKPMEKIKDEFIDKLRESHYIWGEKWRFEADSRVLRKWVMDRIQTE